MSVSDANPPGPFEALRRRLQQLPSAQRCEMCGEAVGDDHRHVVDLGRQRLLCTCQGCGLLFSAEGSGGGRYRVVPDRYVEVATGPQVLALWEALEVPMGVVFFVTSSRTGRVSAFYPGPAGATESLLELGPWQEALGEVPAAAGAAPDVEALLVRVDAGRGEAECFIVPVDACYELAGRLSPALAGLRRRGRSQEGSRGIFR